MARSQTDSRWQHQKIVSVAMLLIRKIIPPEALSEGNRFLAEETITVGGEEITVSVGYRINSRPKPTCGKDVPEQ